MFLSFVGFSAQQFHSYLFERQGFTPWQIGVLLGAGFAADIFAPFVQVAAIRRLKGPRRPLALALAGAGLGTALLPFAGGMASAIGLFAFTLFCSSCINPLNTACTLEVTRSRGTTVFFLLRTLGTVGYLAGCVGSWLRPDPRHLPFLYLGFGLASLLAVPLVRRFAPTDPRQAPEDILVNPHPRRAPGLRRSWKLLGAPRARRLLLTLAAMNFANAMATLVQGNYLTGRFGLGQSSISVAWIVATACEVPIMLLCAWLARKRGLRAVLGLGLLGTTVKLFLLGAADSYGLYLAGLVFHGCFYAGAITGFSLFLDQRYAVADRPSLQALGSLFYAALPLALGGLTAGLLWDFAGIKAVYLTAGLIGLAAGGYALVLLPRLPGRAR